MKESMRKFMKEFKHSALCLCSEQQILKTDDQTKYQSSNLPSRQILRLSYKDQTKASE